MKIVLAGAESNDALKVFRDNPPPSILVSNLYLQKKSPSKIKEILETYKSLGCWVIIDSGAFTFLSKYGILRTDRTIEQFREKYNLHRVVLEDWQYDKEESQRRFDKEFGKYFDVWLSHLDLYYEYSDMIAELDLDALVGIERMGELRQKYEAYKDKICYTPHIGIEKELRLQTPEEQQYLKDLLSSGIKYLGLGNSSHSDVEQFFSRYKVIKENKIRVHGWAQTSAAAITTLPFFSIDSTTWLSAAKFGVTFEYKDGWAKMKSHDHTQKETFRSTCQKECEENGINFEDFCNDEPFSVLQWSALQWIRMAKYYEKDVSRSYWLTQDEASSVIEQQREEQGLNALVVRETTNVNIFKDTRLKINRLCNLCEIATQCPHYIPNNTCIFPTSGLSTDLTSKDLMKAVIDMQMGRVNQAVFSERMKGGSVNSNVTKEIQTLSKMIKEYDAMNQDGTGIHISAKGEESVGVLERLFGGKSEPKTKTEILQAEEAEIIDE